MIDLMIVSLVPFLALYIRFEGVIPPNLYTVLASQLPLIVLVRLGMFYACGLYNRLWRYASINELVIIIGSVTASSAVLTLYLTLINAGLPRSIHILSWIFVIALVGMSRLAIRVYYYIRCKVELARNKQANVLIVGAGDAGATIAREISNRYYNVKKIVGFIDDSPYKISKTLFGSKVVGNRKNIRKVVEQHQVDEIIIAMPSVEGSIVRDIICDCKKTKCTIKTVPGLYELIDGKVSISQLRNVDLEDLLRRDPVKLDLEQIAGYIKGKRVIVTGAGGSIGSELCRQIAKIEPASISLLGKGENSIYEIHRELSSKYPDLKLDPIIADVRDKSRIISIFGSVKPQVVFHAAAHKHVPLMEAQPVEAVHNNIFGTKTVAEAADRANAEVFVMISTDKAVNPTSVMGATKRVAELIVQNLSRVSNTKFVAVRFGNVLGSRGSVVPLFRKQIAAGGPITITHPDMTRYFMTIPEASQLVLQAGALARGGEVFVLDMGEPVKIVDMARDLIELSGLVPDKDINVEFTGLRPGEKLFEELLTAEEGTTSTKHKKIFVANLKVINEEKLQRELFELQSVKDNDEIVKVIENLLPAYKAAREKYATTQAEVVDGKTELKNESKVYYQSH